MRKETKIAIFTILTVALAIWGYKYLRGFNILSNKTTVFAVFDRVDGLRVSTPIYVNGLEVGLVADFKQEPGDLNTIVVEMQLDSDIRLPANAVAEIITNSLMGGTTINLVFTGTCEGQACVQDGARIEGVMKGMLASFATPTEVAVYMEELNAGLQKLFDTLAYRVGENPDLRKGMDDIQATLANLRSTTERLDQLTRRSSGSVEKSLASVATITRTLEESNQQIKTILDNTARLSADLQAANVKDIAQETRTSIRQLTATLETSEKTVAQLGNVLTQLQSGDGALSKLLDDKELATHLSETIRNLDLLLLDIRLHPERYRRILSGKKIPYQAPAATEG
ncbi:MAG: hypothetical protein RLY31_1003 [Bacteroidota bacterium]